MLARLLFMLVLCLSASEGRAGERLALMIGANNGGPGRPSLRYAQRDAERFAEVLQQVGQVAPQAITILLQPRRQQLIEKLEALAQKKPGVEDRELFLYYSGHADEQGLLLGHERVSYEFLRKTLKNLPGRVKLFIIDGCYSGSLTLTKGGSHQSPFLANSAQNAQGIAVMTSSSMDEASQESERLRSSFFTHFLLVGLRGAADFNGDRQVSLNEAYRYAYSETLQATTKTQFGAQHPSYDFQLKGRGDLVLTDLRQLQSAIDFPVNVEATYYLRSKSRDFFLELRKKKGRAEFISLEKGLYEIVSNQGEKYQHGFFEVKDKQTLKINEILFKAVTAEKVVTRGDSGFPDIYQKRVFKLSFWPNQAFGSETTSQQQATLHLIPLIGSIDRLRGIGFGIVGQMSRDVAGLTVSLGFNYNQNSMKGVQLAPAMNVTEELLGGQLGFYNYAYRIESGVQFGFVNISGLSSGHQLGIVNIAQSSDGIQFGIFNYAERSHGLSIAPFVLVKDGIIRAELWADNLGLIHVAIRSGTPYYYSTFYGSTYGASRMIGTGPGLRLPLDDGALAVDYSWALREDRNRTTRFDRTSGTLVEDGSTKALVKLRRMRVFYEWAVSSKIYAMVGLSETTQQFTENKQNRIKLWKPMAIGRQVDSDVQRKQLGLMLGLSYSLVETYQ
jgi:hypothetical protein